MFKLKNTIARDANVDLDDVRNLKTALNRLGFYEVAKHGLTEFPDEPMFRGIENFQSGNGLRKDGVMQPDGETVAALGDVLASQSNSTRQIPLSSDAAAPTRTGNIVNTSVQLASEPSMPRRPNTPRVQKPTAPENPKVRQAKEPKKPKRFKNLSNEELKIQIERLRKELRRGMDEDAIEILE